MHDLLYSHPARMVDLVVTVMDRNRERRAILQSLIEATADCGDHLAALARNTAARCAENPAEAPALLRRAQRRLQRVQNRLATGEDDTLAEMTRDGVTIAALNFAHAAFGAAATALEGN